MDSAAGKLTGGYETLSNQTVSDSAGGASDPGGDAWSIISTQPGAFVAEAYAPLAGLEYATVGSGLQVFDLNEPGLSAWTAEMDLSDLTFKYGDGTGATLTPAVVAIPEPMTVGWLGLAVTGVLVRRKPRRT